MKSLSAGTGLTVAGHLTGAVREMTHSPNPETLPGPCCTRPKHSPQSYLYMLLLSLS